MAPKQCIVEDNKFLKNHLNRLNTDIFGGEGDQKLLDRIQRRRRDTTRLIVALSQLLTEYSQRVYEKMDEEDRPAHPYVFINQDEYFLTRHPHDSQPRKDIIAVPGPKVRSLKPPMENIHRSNRLEVRFDDVVSVVKCKAPDTDGLDDVADHSCHLLSSRPDMVGTYVLWACARSYQIMWSDASGMIASPRYKWTRLLPLAAYISSLYAPPKNHVLFDTTITRTPQHDTTLWTIKSRNHSCYVGCRKLFSGNAWGARTNVWIHQTAHRVVVIKDAFLINGRHRTEEGLLWYIHRRGIYPGVVRLLFTGDQAPSPPLMTTQVFDGPILIVPERTRIRLFMGSYGSPISEARSVKDMLMAFFDILEVLRGLSVEMNVLHRDISTDNIVIYPQHHPDTMKEDRLVECPPIFISQILGKDKTNDGKDKATGLLIDFDQGIQLVHDPTHVVPVDRDRTQRTGTTMFMSRSGMKGAVRYCDHDPFLTTNYQPMPTLEGEVRELYELAYGSETYNRYCDTPETAHGARPKNLRVPGPDKNFPFVHKPHHDVESLCWVMIYMLFHVQPLERTEEVDLEPFRDVHRIFHSDRITNEPGELRDDFWRLSTYAIMNSLDPQLETFAQFIRDLLRQIGPEYDLMDPPPPPEHLHEAIRRMLLKAIYEMDDPIALDPGKSRPSAYPEKKIIVYNLGVDISDSDDDGNAEYGDLVGVDKRMKMETNRLKRKMDNGSDDAAQQDTKRPRGADSIIV